MTTYSLQEVYPNQFTLGGLLFETLTRSGNLPAETLYIDTFNDQGYANVNDFISPQTDGKTIVFAAGQVQSTFDITILNGNTHATNPTYTLEIQQHPTDNDLTYVAKTLFTIPEGNSISQGIVLTGQNFSIQQNASISGPFSFINVSNPGGDVITQYGFWDGGSGNGHFTLNGFVQPDSQWVYVSPANLSTISYVGGSTSGSETLSFAAYDSTTGQWSATGSLIATTTASTSANTIQFPSGNVTLYGTPGNDIFIGGGGIDTVQYSGTRSQYTITNGGSVISVADSVTSRDGTDSLRNIQQVKFTDVTLVFDLHSSQDILVYELYQAAYARTPDNSGFRYWAISADYYYSSAISLADSFLSAPEFTQKYGANPSNAAYVTALYTNVLGRAPDQTGLTYWISIANSGTSHDQLLVSFATSAENTALIGSHISNGCWTT